MRMTIGKRIVSGFAATLLVTAALGGFALMRFYNIESSSGQITGQALPGIRNSLVTEYCMTRNYARVYRHILADQKTKLQIEADMKLTGEEQSAAMKLLEQSAQNDEARQLVKAIDAPRDKYHEVRKEVLALSTQNKTVEATSLANSQLLPAFEQYRQAVHHVVEYNDQFSNAASSQTSSAMHSGKLFIGCGLAIAVVLAATIAFIMIRSIGKILSRIASALGSGSEQVASASGQVSSSSQSLAQGASEQAAALEETTSSLEEMSSMTRKNADTAQQANALSSEAQKAANQGNVAMQKMNTAIKEIEKSAGETAVEAARAGEAGMGFAVVADEVRNLAQRSAEAAKNTASMIEESVNNAKNGVAISSEVAKVLEDITSAAGKVNGLVGEIAAASNEQAQGIAQVNTAVAQMDKVTQSNAANAEESASASEELASQGEQMRGMVGELVALVNGAKASTNVAGPVARQTKREYAIREGLTSVEA